MLPRFDKNNPHYPLPADYPKLSPERQRFHRLELLRSWYDPSDSGTLITDPEAFVYAFQLFKEYYRKGWSDNRAKYESKSPDFHREWIKIFSQYPLSIITSWRGSAKSFLFGEELAEFLIVTRPDTPVQYTTASQGLVEKQIRAVRLDLERNKLIQRDFGDLKPGRSSSLKWTNTRLELANGSSYVGISSDSRQRGMTMLSLRALCQILDDPEVDTRVKNPELLGDFEDFVFNVFFPSAHPKAWRVWSNTLLSPHSWAVKASKKEDERFANWYAVEYKVLFRDPKTGDWRSRWEERFPVKNLLKMAGIEKAEVGENVVSYGHAAFATEFMNDPTLRGTLAFEYDTNRHAFHYETDSQGKLYLVDHLTKKRLAYKDLVARSVPVMGLDVSLARSSHSDLSAIVNCLLDDQGVLWVLHAWTDRVRPVEAAQKLFELGQRWGSKYLGLQKSLLELTMLDFLADEITRRQDDGRYHFDLVELKGMGRAESKAQHILSLQWRFAEDKIRIVTDVPMPWSAGCELVPGSGCLELEDQITSFTNRGAQKYDDLLDALVFCQDVGLIVGRVMPIERKEPSLVEVIEEVRRTGMDVVRPLADFTRDDLLKAMAERYVAPEHTGLTDEEMVGGVFVGGADGWMGGLYGEL